MKKGFLTVLPEGELDRRIAGMRDLGLSDETITALQNNVPKLCPPEKAYARMQNLTAVGFDALQFVSAQPFVLIRSEKEVCAKVRCWQKWCADINADVSIHLLSQCRTQIFSAMIEKVNIVFMIAQCIKKNVTVERICNVVTLNMENVLLAFASNRNADLVQLHYKARTQNIVTRKTPLDKRLRLIRNVRDRLPEKIYEEYMRYKINAHKKVPSQYIVDQLCT